MGSKHWTLAALIAGLAPGIGLLPVHGQTCTAWRKPLPEPISSAAFAYDSARQVIVRFGGYTGYPSGETWEWNGMAWSLRSTSGPSARYGHAMVYDSVRGVTILFGGQTSLSPGISDETWEWDGTAWTRRNPTHRPPVLTSHAMVYDGTRGVALLFGGWSTYGNTDQTWAWDGTDWALLESATRPSPRYEHAMTYDSHRETVVLFGGHGSGGAIDDTWEWDGVAWSQRSSASSPSPRRGHAMVYDAARHVAVLFGGETSPYTNETWEWDGTSWTKRTPVTNPSSRSDHGMIYDSARSVTVMIGGRLHAGGTGGDIWQWNGEDWVQDAVDVPSARTGHAMVYDSGRQVVVMFGGSTGGAETWEYDGSLWIRKATSGPSSRYNHAMAYDSDRHVTVMTSGGGETWEWDGNVWTKKTIAGPSARTGHAMVYDSRRHVVVLFGGYTGTSNNETWEYDGAAWTQRTPTTSPSSRQQHAMAYDSDRGVTVLFGGGLSASGYVFHTSDVWEWNGTDWIQCRLASSRFEPSGRMDHAMLYDTHRHKTILFGGKTVSNDYTNDNWWWDGGSWTRMYISAAPQARASHAMVYDSGRGAVVLFGGEIDNGVSIISSGQTWEWVLGTTRPRPEHVIITTPLLMLSRGVTSGQLEVEIRGAAGELLPANDYCVEYSFDSNIVTVDAAGVVTATPAAIARETTTWVQAAVDGVIADNQALIRCTNVDLGVQHQAFRGNRIAFYAPATIQGFDLAAVAAECDLVAATDLAYEAQHDLIGSLPYRGSLHYFVLDVTNDQNAYVCSLAEPNTTFLGWLFRDPNPISCFVITDPVRPVPQWGVIFHELGHSFIRASTSLYQFINTLGSTRNFTYSEGLATLCGMWARHCLTECPSVVGPLARQSLNTDFDNAKTFYQQKLVEYQNAGKVYSTITPDVLDAIFYEMYDAYGPKAWFDLFSTFQPPNEGLPVNILTDGPQATWIVAAFSASAGRDLREHFATEYGFPIDDTVWPSMLAAAESRIAARPWHPRVGPDFDCDGDVDTDDFAFFRACWTGPALGPPSADCERADFDGDSDVDQSDFGVFQRCYSGTSPAPHRCADRGPAPYAAGLIPRRYGLVGSLPALSRTSTSALPQQPDGGLMPR